MREQVREVKPPYSFSVPILHNIEECRGVLKGDVDVRTLSTLVLIYWLLLSGDIRLYGRIQVHGMRSLRSHVPSSMGCHIPLRSIGRL